MCMNTGTSIERKTYLFEQNPNEQQIWFSLGKPTNSTCNHRVWLHCPYSEKTTKDMSMRMEMLDNMSKQKHLENRNSSKLGEWWKLIMSSNGTLLEAKVTQFLHKDLHQFASRYYKVYKEVDKEESLKWAQHIFIHLHLGHMIYYQSGSEKKNL